MTAFDFIVLFIVAVSAAIAAWRGFVREVLALGSWIISFWIARLFAGVVAGWLPAAVSHQGLRYALAFIAIMLVSVLALGLLTTLAVRLVKVAGLTSSDRMLGALFGVLRGVLIAAVLVLMGGMTSEPHEPYWRNALLARPLQQIALLARPWLPDEVARRVSFE
ncbi:MAG TPA: CvpA family protein [Burkholderiales bacterium]|nr:CvpA family protein [Burkholderiales bacterium]